MTRNGRPIYPSQLPENFGPRDVRRMLRSWRGRSDVPEDVKAIQRIHKALVELHARYMAAFGEIRVLYGILDDLRQKVSVDTDTLIEEAQQREVMSSFLNALLRELGPKPIRRETVEKEVIDKHKSEYHRAQHMQDWREDAGVGRKTVDGQQRRAQAANEHRRDATRGARPAGNSPVGRAAPSGSGATSPTDNPRKP